MNRQIKKLIVRREVLAMDIKEQETKGHDQQKADDMRRQLWQLDNRLVYAAGKTFHVIEWRTEHYTSRSGAAMELSHPAGFKKVSV